jgi:two-component system cell cycle response regulator DivK
MAHMLIIEDDRDTRNVTELILAEAGHTADTASDGLKGLALAERVQPDLILMDLGLPRLDGWETTRRLKENPATRGIPIVAFTAYVHREHLDRAFATGCVAAISKPFRYDALLHDVAEILAQHKVRSKLANQTSSEK